MKTPGTLCVALGLLFTTAVAQAEPLDLQQEWFYSNAPGYETGARTHLFAGRNGDTYGVGADFYLESLSVDNATLYIYWYDEELNQIYEWVESGPIEADCDCSMMDASITLPPGSTGRLWVEFSIYFVDGSELYDFSYADFE